MSAGTQSTLIQGDATTGRPASTSPRLPNRTVRQVLARHSTAIVVILALLAGWELASRSGLLAVTTFPSMSATARALVDLLVDPAFWHQFGLTVTSWLIGVAIACALGIPAGLLLGRSQFLYRSSRLLVDFLRTIPSVAVIPLITLLVGATMEMKIILVVYGAFWPILIQTVYGVQDTDRVLTDTGRSYRLSNWHRIAFVFLPSTLPYLVTGLRIATVVGLLLAISSEILGSAPGIGLDLALAQSAGALDLTYAYVVFIGLLGVLVNICLNRISRAVLSWHASERKDAS
jgi:ABC-type nitrate/sulfonate/bicarbonate transport system permease component